jgi:hypothetical protein
MANTTERIQMLTAVNPVSVNERDKFSFSLREHWILLSLAVLFYFLLYCWYYPPICGIEDEVGFVNQALVWSKGAISAEGAGLTFVQDFVQFNGHHLPWRNPGRSLIIFPLLVIFGLKAIFVSGALIHAALTLVAGLIHSKLGQSPLWAILVLCHPTLEIYSRTIMGDAPAGLCLLLALFVILFRVSPGIPAGILIGLGAVMRYHVGLLLPIVATVMWFDRSLQHSKREALRCLFSGGGIGLLIAVYNLSLFGKPFGWTNQGFFSLSFFSSNVQFYAVALMVIWPGLLIAPLFDSSRISRYVHGMCWPVLALFSLYYFHDRGATFGETAVLGQRFLQCVLPVWIVSYSTALSRNVLTSMRAHLPGKLLAMSGVIACTVLLIGQILVFSAHQRHLRFLQSVRGEIIAKVPEESTIVSNYMVQKLFGIEDPALPRYKWLPYRTDAGPGDFTHLCETRTDPRPLFLVFLPKWPGDIEEGLGRYVKNCDLTAVPTHEPRLLLYAAPGH